MRSHQRALRRGHHARHALRTTLRIEAVHPVHFHIGLAQQEFAGDAIEHVHQAIAVGPQHHLARLALPGDVGQHRHLRRVVVQLVMRRELVVPFQLACIGIERDHAVAVEVVAQARAAIPVGRRIARAPVDQVRSRDRRRRGSRSRRRPSARNRRTRFHAPASPGPGMVWNFQTSRPVLHVIRRDKSADSHVAARGADVSPCPSPPWAAW